MINIAIIGATGRMGRMVMEAMATDEQVRLVGALVSPSSSLLGQDSGLVVLNQANHIPFRHELNQLLAHGVTIDGGNGETLFPDVLIDFSTLDGALRTATLCAQSHTPLVMGVTGFDHQAQDRLNTTARHAAYLQAANFSLGVNLALQLTQKMAAALPDSYDIEILEMHHHHKVDAPSGTALALGRQAALGRKIDHDEKAVLSREGQVGRREQGSIGYATLRGGDVVGEHDVIFASQGERITLSHKASSRMIFAKGALYAAKWLADKPAGYYSMAQVLNLGETG